MRANGATLIDPSGRAAIMPWPFPNHLIMFA
jgi:hypothetical protein